MKCFICAVLLLATGVANAQFQKVPTWQVSFPTGETYYAISPTADTAQVVFEELDAAVSNLNADVVAATGAIATAEANIASNAANIATNTANIATNTADIATNTANIATNTADIATYAADLTFIGHTYTMIRTNPIASGAASPSVHSITQYDYVETGSLTNGLNLTAGTFTPPKNGFYQITGGMDMYNQTWANEFWMGVALDGSYALASGGRTIFQSEGELGYMMQGGWPIPLTTNNSVSLMFAHEGLPLGASNYIYNVIFSATYLGE